ncbi:Acetoacetyl CoA synthase NphT7 [Rubripirellula lacrimiformis]|uniref:Acetoacetyl CoA synthase NphT7 n=1 Tax=Rubripirellula lacrimiformis TaxID=1930273 RepID=A0A517N8T9_9BACT|nr:ketoacyl-ACP synthase III [Rubripirellula lacrimiformis]QDT03532.1 Acetoacetyl CoA synthase NphT7 [Rubripirellula lacrimiformis]
MVNNKLGIEKVGCYLPSARLDTLELGHKLGATDGFVSKKLGFTKLARKPDCEMTSDMCVSAHEDFAEQCHIHPEIGCLAVVTQNPDAGGIPHTSSIVHQKLGLSKRIACFDISLGCTGFVHGASIMIGFMRENGIKNGLLFTADPYSAVVSPSDRDTALLFGDGATCTLISSNPKYTLGRSRYLTDSKHSNAIRTIDNPRRTLSMNGSDVFRFVAKHVPREINDCLYENGLTIDQIDRFLIHQGSKFIVETLAAAIHAEPSKIAFTAETTGNTVSSSIPLMLAKVLQEETAPPTNLLLAGFGVGLSSFVTTLKRSK